ncbi:GDSL-type esterase/lipase family protein [Kiloniella laminariae]|uniref:GDSL-type esterase/lipase family protein n=1 Tax=Kiloniella laminariae TaxID=454162 RepID=UPI00036DEAA5|nr:GDSL-type esterase/lipase family protein [Kiloniella laminariae]
MKRICFVGASIMEGMGDEDNLGLPARLTLLERSKNRDFIPYNLGIRGQTLREISLRASQECLARFGNSSDTGIVLATGSNDFAMLEQGLPRTPPHRAMQQLKNLIQQLQEIAPLVVFGPTPVDETKMPVLSPQSNMLFYFSNNSLASASQGYQQVCAAENTPYLDIFSILQNNPDYLAGLRENDGLHSNAVGYQAMARALSESSIWESFFTD